MWQARYLISPPDSSWPANTLLYAFLSYLSITMDKSAVIVIFRVQRGSLNITIKIT